ncbi:MAG: regulatory protein RecX [Dehalococcoidales bacterium]|jgi:regulatory protein|nr:regulatory protein RecX [Dehalococcoidales bacterium]MDD4229839.1 regulatory protein RecX [Dehalococcoidales bacterium]MDD4465254.1 regulatory protein RecX [Dehalococcoidales bacterium]MDD5401661.1 regulatory protein RecX [Dehalococcoidales bacterium]NLE90570.1 regulatory protein RecX [Dehalococcoidales bacterium]
MGLVTGLEMNTGKNMARLFIDGSHALTLSVEVILENKIKDGMEISQKRIEALKEDEEAHICKKSAYRLLAFRARSEKELRDRLVSKGFSPKAVDKTVDHLKASGLIDDREFGRQWAENRLSFKPQSAYLTRRELKAKGLSEEAIEEAVKDYDDYENALSAARAKAVRSIGLDYIAFKRRVGSFLQRRGFGYEIIKPVIDELWKELTEYKNSRENLQ